MTSERERLEPMQATIVSFRWSALEDPEQAIERARTTTHEATATGGELVAFGGFELAYRFALDEVEAAAFFARSIVQRVPTLGRAGIAIGEIAFLPNELGREGLGWGEPLVVAAALARLAELGSVLVLADLAEVHEDVLQPAGPGKDFPFGGKARRTVKLEALTFEDAEDVDHPHNLTDTAQATAAKLTFAQSSYPPPRRSHTGSYDLLELARSALSRADSVPLDTAVSELNLSAGNREVVERLAGVLAMTRGASEEGLRVLRRAAESEQNDDRRARAILAYSIGVASAGRHEEALLEALNALAITRRTSDVSGERACARVLGQLAFANGHADAASAWAHVGERLRD